MRVVICGGGVIGAAIAYFLSKRGAEPVVIERHEVAGAAVVGSSPYFPSAAQGEPWFTEPLEFTITIKTQKTNRFVGELTDGKRTEKLVGAISPNNLGGIILDDDGQYVFTIRDIETLDVCYSHTTPSSKVVACYPWTKNK